MTSTKEMNTSTKIEINEWKVSKSHRLSSFQNFEKTSLMVASTFPLLSSPSPAPPVISICPGVKFALGDVREVYRKVNVDLRWLEIVSSTYIVMGR